MLLHSAEGRPTARVTTRSVSLVVVALGAVGLALLSAFWVPWSTAPVVPVGLEDELFTATHLARVDEYTDRARFWSWTSLVLTLLWYVVVASSTRVRAWFGQWRGPWWMTSALAVGLLLLGQRLITLPLSYGAFRNRVDHGISTQDWTGWLRDVGVGLASSIVVQVLLVLLVLGALRRLPRFWPVLVGCVLAVLVVSGSWLYPVFVEPLHNQFSPLPQGELRDAVMALAQDEGVDVGDVVVADASRRTTTYNAWVSGFGSTRRIVLHDTLVEELPRGQVLAVVAHELAHARHQHVLTGTLLGASGAVLGAGLLGLLLPRRQKGAGGVPLVMLLVLVGLQVSAPVQSGVSRSMEREADRTAVQVTGDPESFVTVQVSLATRALSDPRPPRWSQFLWGTHPTVLERVDYARRGVN
ncbi:M48 family metalloprotease [Nocardioides yefusunii]|uniref:M48 family metalloprotease n=1 Tax=Nocardioides yefusunii TaxID=2500546 RepID=A0ABW1QZT6_9ACTN|nr:M48 family metalloprotease [Nocardioides yefusunii]